MQTTADSKTSHQHVTPQHQHEPPSNLQCIGMGLRLSLTDRLAPLSEGRIQNGNLACNYHGWEFDRKGACLANPQVGPLLPCCILHWLHMVDRKLDHPIV